MRQQGVSTQGASRRLPHHLQPNAPNPNAGAWAAGVSSDNPRESSDSGGPDERDHGVINPGNTVGEHSGQQPEGNVDDDDDEEAPETPTDEPSPIPVQDPPVGDRAPPPMTVVGYR